MPPLRDLMSDLTLAVDSAISTDPKLPLPPTYFRIFHDRTFNGVSISHDDAYIIYALTPGKS